MARAKMVIKWGAPDMNGLRLWQLIQRCDALQTQRLFVFRKIKNNLWADYMKQFLLS